MSVTIKGSSFYFSSQIEAENAQLSNFFEWIKAHDNCDWPYSKKIENPAYTRKIYVDENDLQKPAPKILSFKQINEKSIKVIWKLDKHPEGKELKFFNVEIAIGLDVDCCGPGTNEETFEEANSEPIPAEIREFVISNHKGQPLKDKTEYCVEIEVLC